MSLYTLPDAYQHLYSTHCLHIATITHNTRNLSKAWPSSKEYLKTNS